MKQFLKKGKQSNVDKTMRNGSECRPTFYFKVITRKYARELARANFCITMYYGDYCYQNHRNLQTLERNNL